MIIRFTAFPPPPPQPMTLMRASATPSTNEATQGAVELRETAGRNRWVRSAAAVWPRSSRSWWPTRACSDMSTPGTCWSSRGRRNCVVVWGNCSTCRYARHCKCAR